MESGLAQDINTPYKSTFGHRLGAYFTGLSNLPVDVFRYSGMGANKALNAVGLRDDKTAADVSKFFQEVKNPLDFNNYAEKEPEMFKIGEVVSELATALRALKSVQPTGQLLAKTPINLPPRVIGVTTSGLAKALTQGSIQEYGVEPTLDKILTVKNDK